MKLVILTMLFLCSTTGFSNWVPSPDSTVVWKKKSRCQQVNLSKCYNAEGKDRRRYSIGFLSPKVEETLDCIDGTDCQQKIDNFVFQCPAGTPTFDEKSNWPALDFGLGRLEDWFLWCQIEDLVLDSAKNAAVDAMEDQKAQEQAMIEDGRSAILVGKKAKELMVGYIKSKKLPKSNRKQLRKDLKSILDALDVGSIDVAIDEIKALTEDPVVVTPEAKALILKVFADAGYDIS